MKKLAFLTIALFSFSHSFSQAIVTITDYQKIQEPAIQYEIPYAEETVTKAIEDTLEKQGYKGKDTKGYTLYRDVHSTALGPDTYNLYFKVNIYCSTKVSFKFKRSECQNLTFWFAKLND